MPSCRNALKWASRLAWSDSNLTSSSSSSHAAPAVDSETETETQTDEAAAETLLGVDAETELEPRDDGAADVATGIVIDQSTEVISKVSCQSVSIR